MIKRLMIATTTVALAAVAMVSGASASSAASVRQPSPYVDCGGSLIRAAVSQPSSGPNYEGFLGNFVPGQTYTCSISGYVNRALPLVGATLSYGNVDFVRSAGTQFGSSSTRVGAGLFNYNGNGTVRITIPKTQAYGYNYELDFANLFDSNQDAYGYVCIGSYSYCLDD